MIEPLEHLLDRLREAGGEATGGDWTLAWEGRVARYLLTKADQTVVLFIREDLLDYARREPGLFKHRQWVLAA